MKTFGKSVVKGMGWTLGAIAVQATVILGSIFVAKKATEYTEQMEEDTRKLDSYIDLLKKADEALKENEE